ncbi:MAG TPA: hypothetical protein VMD74_05525 [Candidatus Methylomirabilis sp.]|nr:hypothetical protein [Candidatus Methylomirabilis sp.]
MRRWVVKGASGVAVKFQPDNPEESRQLDELLGFSPSMSRVEISDNRDLSVADGARQAAYLTGHEAERTIFIPLILTI